MDGLNVGGVQAIVVEGLAQETDHFEQRGFRDKRVAPRRIEECLLRHHRSGAGDKRRKNAERARRKRNLDVASPQPVVGVEPEGSERNLQTFRLSSGKLQDAQTARAAQL